MEIKTEDVEEPACTIESLLAHPFSMRSLDEQKILIARGQPKPSMKRLTYFQSSKKGYFNRHFNVNDYNKHVWLSGSDTLQKLFCWPCILFSNVKTNDSWTKGYCNLSGLTNAVKTHASSRRHIRCAIKLAMFEKTGGDMHLQTPYHNDVKKHNETVARNQEVLRRLINAICYLAKTDSSFCVQEEEFTTACSQYADYLSSVSEFDPLLANHLESSDTFNAFSIKMHNELIHAVESVMIDQIKEEVREAKYAAIILDETYIGTKKSQISTVLRYIVKDGLVYERFVGYTDFSIEKTSVALFDHVVKIVEEFTIQDKLVACAYDGAATAIAAEQLSDLTELVRRKYPAAVRVFDSTHQLSTVLPTVCSRNIKECHLFFSILLGIPTFFANSPKRRSTLNAFMSSLPNAPTHWDFSFNAVTVIVEILPELIQFFEHVLDNPEDWDEETLIRAQGYIYFLPNFANVFMLVTFSTLFGHMVVLENVLLTANLDPDNCLQTLLDTKESLLSEICLFNSVWEKAHSKWAACQNVTQTARRTSHVLYSRDSQKQLYIDIINQLVTNITERHISMKKFVFIDLLNHESYTKLNQIEKEVKMKTLTEVYSGFFDNAKLKSELDVLHDYAGGFLEFQNLLPHQLAASISSQNLHHCLTELDKLLSLYLTIPSTPLPESEGQLPASQRIRSFAITTHGQERYSNLAVLSIEKRLLGQLKESPDFCVKVIENFNKQEQRMEFTYI